MRLLLAVLLVAACDRSSTLSREEVARRAAALEAARARRQAENALRRSPDGGARKLDDITGKPGDFPEF